MSDIPNHVIDAALDAGTRAHRGVDWIEREMVIAILTAAAPHIAAAERERCAQMAEQDAGHADLQVASDEARIVGEVLRHFAAKLREPQP